MSVPNQIAVLAGAAEQIDVRLIDTPDDAIGLRDLIVPIGALIAALIGGLGGVLLGGRMNRTTLRQLEQERADRDAQREAERAEREDKLDAARGDRERELEVERERRSIDAEKRQTVGALRMVLRHFDLSRNALSVMIKGSRVSPRLLDIDPGIRDEDTHRIATWLEPDAWAVYAAVTSSLRLHRQKEPADKASDRAITQMRQTYDHLGRCTQQLRQEITRLLSEIGDPASKYDWPMVPDYLGASESTDGATSESTDASLDPLEKGQPEGAS